MGRIARDRDEKETADKAARERERLKNMTEDERAAWERANPKVRARFFLRTCMLLHLRVLCTHTWMSPVLRAPFLATKPTPSLYRPLPQNPPGLQGQGEGQVEVPPKVLAQGSILPGGGGAVCTVCVHMCERVVSEGVVQGGGGGAPLGASLLTTRPCVSGGSVPAGGTGVWVHLWLRSWPRPTAALPPPLHTQEDADDARGTVNKDSIFTRDYSAPTGEAAARACVTVCALCGQTAFTPLSAVQTIPDPPFHTPSLKPGEDNFDKASMPAVMQVRNFGRTGRTKWKHLLAEDTSVARKEDEWWAVFLRGLCLGLGVLGVASWFAVPVGRGGAVWLYGSHAPLLLSSATISHTQPHVVSHTATQHASPPPLQVPGQPAAQRQDGRSQRRLLAHRRRRARGRRPQALRRRRRVLKAKKVQDVRARRPLRVARHARRRRWWPHPHSRAAASGPRARAVCHAATKQLPVRCVSPSGWTQRYAQLSPVCCPQSASRGRRVKRGPLQRRWSQWLLSRA